MRKTGNIYLAVITALLAIWLLPRLWYIITAKPYSTPFTLYSCIAGDFVSLEDRSGRDFTFKDTHGREYNDSVLPFFYYRVLSSRNNIPETINGRQFTGDEIERENIFFSSSPKEVNIDSPNVYMLLESNPPRLELEDPEYALVARKDGVKIIEMATNMSDAVLERSFNEALDSVGFRFPAQIVSGNPSHHKTYDEGYILTDADGGLYHLKLADGKPQVESIDNGGLDIKHIFITENENRASLAYLFDAGGRFYVLDSLRRIIGTDVVADVTRQNVLLVGDILNFTVRVSDSDGEDFWALDTRDLHTVKTMRRDYPEPDSVDLPKYIFPARLVLSSSLDGRIRPRLVDFSCIGLCVDITALAAALLFAKALRKKREQLQRH